MQIGRFRVPFTAAAAPEKVERSKAPRGATGTINYEGYLSSTEYNQDLIGSKGFDVWDEMLRSDASVREAMGHITAPIKNARWNVVAPEDPNDLEIEVTEFVRSALFDWSKQSFLEFLDEALEFLVFGHYVFETIYMVTEKSLNVPTIEEEHSTTPPPQASNGKIEVAAAFPPSGGGPSTTPILPPPTSEPREIPPRQFVTWRRFSPRLPKTISKWNVDEFEELVSITQEVTKGSQTITVDIPSEDLFVLSYQKRGAEWTGQSILRSAYKPWYLKAVVERIAGIAYERHGVGIPVAYLPREREADDAVADTIEQMLQDLRAGEFSYLLFPGPKAQGNQAGYTFEIVSPPSGIPDFTPILEYLRGEIKAAVLARFSELGHTGSGARATATVQAEVWYNALHAIARFFEDSMDDPIRKLVDMNYEGVTRYPRMHASGIESRNLLEFAQSVSLLGNARFLYPDTPTRDWIRDTIDAPKENPEEAEMQQQMELQSFNLEQQMNERQMNLVSEKAETIARPRASKVETTPSNKPD